MACDPADLEGLRARARKVHKLLIRKHSVRERFRQIGRSFWDKLKSWWEANDAYEAALRPFDEKIYDCCREQRRYTRRMGELRKQGLQTSAEYRRLEKAKKRCIEEKARAEEERATAKAEPQDPGPCPTDWLRLSPHIDLAQNERDLMEHMFPDRSVMTDEAERLRSYVLLTILHDHALKGEVAPIASDDVWPRDAEAVREDFGLTVWRNMQDDPSSWCGAIDTALVFVRADLASATPQEAETSEAGRQAAAKAREDTGKTKATRPRARKKTPPQLLKETRERQAVKELARNPEITARELGTTLGCDASTVVRLKAWKNRGVLHRDPPRR